MKSHCNIHVDQYMSRTQAQTYTDFKNLEAQDFHPSAEVPPHKMEWT
ncbi:hypothetical protein V1387_17880 [Allomuricauda taeanensis]|nr:hypothetical protein [Allomuricauda taeanensis]MEE1964563.1 hypothetical protein [Allomuricauda taeanensis]